MIKAYTITVDDVVRQIYLYAPPNLSQLTELFDGEGMPDIKETVHVSPAEEYLPKLIEITPNELIHRLMTGEGHIVIYASSNSDDGYWYVSIDEFESEVGAYDAS